MTCMATHLQQPFVLVGSSIPHCRPLIDTERHGKVFEFERRGTPTLKTKGKPAATPRPSVCVSALQVKSMKNERGRARTRGPSHLNMNSHQFRVLTHCMTPTMLRTPSPDTLPPATQPPAVGMQAGDDPAPRVDVEGNVKSGPKASALTTEQGE
jgi:hypothetical protein